MADPPDIPRIRGNVQKMLSQNAPEADIDAYLSSEGVNAAALRAAKGPRESIPADIAKSLGAGLEETGIGLAGLPGDALRLGHAGMTAVGNQFSPGPAATPKPATGLPPADFSIPGSKEVREYVEGRFGPVYQPQTVLGEYMRTLGHMAPGAALPGGLAMRAANVVVPTFLSETAGQATKGTAAEPYARIGSALMGMPAVGGRAITPLPATRASRDRFVNILADEGVDALTAGQRSGNKRLQWLESSAADTPFAGGQRITDRLDRQKEQLTTAASRRIGENEPLLDDQAMARAIGRIGGQFDDLAARNVAQADQQILQDVQGTIGNYYNLVETPNRVPAVTNYARELFNSLQRNNGQLPGEVYQSLRSRMEATARETSNNEARRAIRDLRNNVDDMMERSIRANNPADAGVWQETRRQYRNFLALEDAMTKAGAETAEGLISPSQLRQAAKDQGTRAYATGGGDFGLLGRAAEVVMKPLPQSGTGPRSMLTHAADLIGVPLAVGRTTTNPFMQAYLGNQIMSPLIRGTNARRSAIVQALTGEPRLQLEAPR